MLGGMLTKDRKPPDGFSDWDSFYEHGAREILPKLERAPSPYDHVRQRAALRGRHGDVCIDEAAHHVRLEASGGKTPTVADLVAAIHRGAR